MNMRYDLIGLLLLSSSVCAMDTMEWSFQTLQMIDMMQTIEIMDDPRYKELNPIFRGRTDGEVYALFLTGSILHYAITNRLSGKYRKRWLQWTNLVSFGFVFHNHKLGVRLSF